MSSTDQPVVLVTGASRGAGKGIAVALAPGATVYVTGRSTARRPGPDGLPGTVAETAAEIDRRGGHGVAVTCDHGDDTQVEMLFERIESEQGRLDILVNNATALPAMPDSPRQGFWERPLEDEVKPLDVGLRSHYVAGHLAAAAMAPAGSGLIAFTSSPGARTYLPGVHGPSYGAGKAGSDKMAFDMAQELGPHGVAVVSLWMGVLRTERVEANFAANPKLAEEQFPGIESPEYTGRVIAALARDPQLLERTGNTFYVSEIGNEYGVVDVDGSQPPSYRDWLGPPSSFETVAPTHAAFSEADRV